MELIDRLKNAFNTLRFEGVVKTQREFAALLNRDETTISRALKEDRRYLTDNLVEQAEQAVLDLHTPKKNFHGFMTIDKVREVFPSIAEEVTEQPQEVLVPLLPTSARAGTLADFAQTVTEYECERIISPVKGADYAIQVTGDSMAPEYEPGCQVLIKKIFEDQFVEWGKTYVLDTMNGSVIKKIFPTEDSAVIECRSVNPQYPPFRVKCEHIHGWYRVLMILALK